MRRCFTAIALVAASASLAACAGGPRERGPSNQIIERVLTNAPGEAQPSSIVSTELAFARAAKEDGQWTAFREYAAPGAVIHGRNGVIAAEGFLAGQSDPDIAVQWAPRTVVMSCDGDVAASLGRFVDRDGLVGNYVTIWQRQEDRSYRYVYDAGGPDVPQPPPRPDFEDGDIVVTALDLVEGLIATCPRVGLAIPPPPPLPIELGTASDAKLSRDGTLRWRWEHGDDGTKFVSVEYFFEGQWITAIDESLASPS